MILDFAQFLLKTEYEELSVTPPEYDSFTYHWVFAFCLCQLVHLLLILHNCGRKSLHGSNVAVD